MANCHPVIEFEKEIYLPGEEVTGRAWVSTNKPMKAKSVQITFTGRTVTAYGSAKKESPKAKKGEEVYVEMKHEVWTPDDEEDTFPGGDYEWKFSFELPKDCPPSYEGNHGCIRYSVLLHMEIPNLPAKNIERAVTVSPIIDLNNVPGAADPVKINVDTTAFFCQCMPCLPARGNVIYTLTSPKLGYVPGEAVTVSGQINNGTSKPIRKIEAKLYCKTTYREELPLKNKKRNSGNADGFKSRSFNNNLETKIERCNILPESNSDFSFTFVIPPVVATIKNSKFIIVEYFVSVWGDSGICNRGNSASLNILVGNVPISSGSSYLPPQKFVDGAPALFWKNNLKPEFTYQLPYYAV